MNDLIMECLARRKLADYLVVALLPSFSVMTCLGLAERCSHEHRSPRLGGGDMYSTHSLFSAFHTK